jgi:antitoxin component YwqK of YwqJK toxin-antitoxin module
MLKLSLQVQLVLCTFLFIQADLPGTRKNMFTAADNCLHDSCFVEEVNTAINDYAGNGMLEAHNSDKTIYYKASVKNKRLDGNWESWYSNNNRRDSGSFVKGIPDGEWKVWTDDGRLLFIRHYSAEVMQAVQYEVVRYHPKQIHYSLTDLYHHNLITYKKHTESRFLFAPFTNSYRPVFKKAMQHGLFINYLPNGIAKDSGCYKQGLQAGVWKIMDNNNDYFIGAYSNGNKIKEWKKYSAAGKLVAIEYYEQGRLVRKKDFSKHL